MTESQLKAWADEPEHAADRWALAAAVLALFAERDALKAGGASEADHRFDPMSDRVIVTGEGWRALKTQAARAEAAEAKLAEAERELAAERAHCAEHAKMEGAFSRRIDALEKALSDAESVLRARGEMVAADRAALAGKEGP